MSEIKIQPLGTRVVVQPLVQDSKTASGLYIPETAKEKPQNGEVVAIGDDEDIKLKVGDKVLFPKYTGDRFQDGRHGLHLDGMQRRAGPLAGLIQPKY